MLALLLALSLPPARADVYGEIRSAVINILREVGRESAPHLFPPAVFLTGSPGACENLIEALFLETNGDPWVYTFNARLHGGSHNQNHYASGPRLSLVHELQSGLAQFSQRHSSGTILIRGRPPTSLQFMFDQAVMKMAIEREMHHNAKFVSLRGFAFIFETYPAQALTKTLMVQEVIKGTIGGVARGCTYHVVPGLMLNARVGYANECEGPISTQQR